MDYSTEVTLPLVKKVMEDVPKAGRHMQWTSGGAGEAFPEFNNLFSQPTCV